MNAAAGPLAGAVPAEAADLPPALVRPDLRFLWEAVHDRYCRQAAGRPVRRVVVRNLDADQQRALAALLGWRRLPGHEASVAIGVLDRVLLASDAGVDARAVAEALCGPVVNRPEQARVRQRRREERWARLAEAAGPRFEGWIEHLRRSGVASRAATAAGRDVEALVGQALAVARRLPGDGVMLAALAGEVLGDPHGLDVGRPLRHLVLSAAGWSRDHGVTPVPVSVTGQRLLLEQVGVSCDALSSSALVLNLAVVPTGYLGRLVAESAEVGEPVRLTMRALLGPHLVVDGERRVLVCENPSVVQAAADRLGAGAPPLVCTEGWPGVAVLHVLDHLASSGAALFFCADFDAGGIRIGNALVDRLAAVPWRMGAADYEEALAGLLTAGGGDGGFGVGVAAPVPAARWDAELAPALARRGVAVYEEQRLDALLAGGVAAERGPG